MRGGVVSQVVKGGWCEKWPNSTDSQREGSAGHLLGLTVTPGSCSDHGTVVSAAPQHGQVASPAGTGQSPVSPNIFPINSNTEVAGQSPSLRPPTAPSTQK